MSTLKRALAGAVGAALLAHPGLVATAQAQSLQDLQQIIQQQQRQLEAQQQALETLRQQVDTISRKTEASSAALTAGSSQAKVVQSGQEKVKLSVSGQVNRGLLFVDDGVDTDTIHVDNDNSSTRIRFIGEARASDDFTIGTQMEVQFESNSTANVSQDNQRGAGDDNFTQRKLELYLDSKRYGRLWLGQGDTASNGSSEEDLSGVGVIGYSGVADLAGGIQFRNSQTEELTGINIGSVFSNFDGLSRDDRIRYDTPSFSGFKASVSAIADDRWDIALRHSGQFGSLKTAAAIAYADPNNDTVDNQINGSLSMLHDSGVNLTLAAGAQDHVSRDPEFWYVKLGYITELNSWGETAFAIDYTKGDDIGAAGDSSTAYGGFMVQNLKHYGTELYLGVRHYELDRPGTPTEDVFAVLAGARVKF